MITYREHKFIEWEGSEESEELILVPKSQGILLELRRNGRVHMMGSFWNCRVRKRLKSARNSNNPDTTCYVSARRRNS